MTGNAIDLRDLIGGLLLLCGIACLLEFVLLVWKERRDR